MQPKSDSSANAFVPVDLGLAMRHPDPYKTAVAHALALWKWVRHDREFKGLNERGLGADGIASITGMSESKAKQVLNQMVKLGEAEAHHGRRDLGERTTWTMTAKPMTWGEAKLLLTVRLPQGRTVKGQLPLLGGAVGTLSVRMPSDRPDTTNRASGHSEAGRSAPQGQTVDGDKPKDQDQGQVLRPKDKTKEQYLPAVAGEGRFKKSAQEFRTYFAEQFEDRFKFPMTKPRFQWIAGMELELLKQHGFDELKRRTHNYLWDPIAATKDYADFLRTPDRWITKREALSTGWRQVEEKRSNDRRTPEEIQEANYTAMMREMGGKL